MTDRSGVAKLRPRARLIGLIGEDLISDEPVAVVELVKNAYDADAAMVTVRFSDPSEDRLVVQDDGHGMNLETVLSTWFEPGTNSKTRSEKSPGGRIYQGAKGIGRFASARLARTLYLESRTGSGDEAVAVLFDWGSFNDEAYLDEIEIAWEQSDVVYLANGTRLTLEGLRKRWTHDDFQELHSRLSRLISPFSEVTDFRIELVIPGNKLLSGEVQAPVLLLHPRYQLNGTVDADGCFDGTLLRDGNEVKTFTQQKLGGRGSKPACGPFTTEIRVWDRDQEGLGPVATRLGQSVTEVRRTLNDYSGVSIYRDGFRVYPYGQRGNDWLNLDNRSRQNPVLRLANNQIVGAIKISRDTNPDLRDRSTREGLVFNEAYSALQAWFKEVLEEIEAYRYDFRPRRQTESTRDPLFEAFDIRETVSQARTALGPDHEVAALIAQLERQVSEGVDRVQEVCSRLLMSAGLGQMVDLVIHEIGAPIGKINRQVDVIEKHVGAASDPELAQAVLPMLTSIKGWLEQVYNLRQRLDPQTAGRRGRATGFSVRDEVEDTFRLYDALMQGQNINWRIDGPEAPLQVFMARSALAQVLANLVDNAIFWLIRDKGSGNGGTIRAAIKPLDSGFAITVSDDGPGVPNDDRAKMFEPYFSRKPNGMGLGLYIARLVIEPYGKLVYDETEPLGGASFEAEFEHGVGL